MKVDTGIWGKLTRIVIFLLIIVPLVAIVIFFFLPNIRHNQRMRKEIQRLDAQVEKEQDTFKDVKSSIEGLRTDPKAVERLAREKLGYAKPGETVVRFDDLTTNAPPLSNNLDPQQAPAQP